MPQSFTADVIAPPAATHSRVEARVAYAGFWLRAFAYLIDTVIISVGLAVIGAFRPALFLLTPNARITSLSELPQLTPTGFAASVLAVWLYYALFESSAWQATPGKRALKLYVTDMNGNRITFVRASMRVFAKAISGLTFLIGYFMAGVTQKKQALHDLLTGCLVLRRL